MHTIFLKHLLGRKKTLEPNKCGESLFLQSHVAPPVLLRILNSISPFHQFPVQLETCAEAFQFTLRPTFPVDCAKDVYHLLP